VDRGVGTESSGSSMEPAAVVVAASAFEDGDTDLRHRETIRLKASKTICF